MLLLRAQVLISSFIPAESELNKGTGV